MSDAPFMISPAGFIADVNFNPSGPENGFANISPGKNPNNTPSSGPGPFAVTAPLPGAFVQLRGTGETDLTGQLNAFQGSLQADIVTTTAAPAEAIATIVGNVGPTTLYLGILLDSQNRPFFRITDAGGVLVAFSAPAGAAIPAGIPLQIRFGWDARGKILPGFALLKINNTIVSPATYTVPTSSWTVFNPVAVLVGVGGYGSLTDYGGSIVKVQASNTPITS